jgi:hypothetical protein
LVITKSLPVITEEGLGVTKSLSVMTEKVLAFPKERPVITQEPSVITGKFPVVTEARPSVTGKNPVITKSSAVVTEIISGRQFWERAAGHGLEFRPVPGSAPKREFQQITPAGRQHSRNIYAAETGAGAAFDKVSRPQRSIRSVVSQLIQESVRETP